jgi:hypothetical protein
VQSSTLNMTLFRKELYGLRFAAVLFALYFLIPLVCSAPFEFPDRPDLTGSGEPYDFTDVLAYQFIMAIAMGVSVLGQEREHSTMSFLDALPITRRMVFVHKAVAAGLVAVLLECFVEIDDVFFTWLTMDSLSTPIDTLQIIANFCVRSVLTLSMIGGVVLLSFSRKFFALLFGVVIWIIVRMAMGNGAISAWFDCRVLLEPEVADGHILWPFKPLIGYTTLGIVSWSLACIFFSQRDGRVAQYFDRFSQSSVFGYVTAVGYVLAAGIWVLLLTSTLDDGDSGSDDYPAIFSAAGEEKSGAALPESIEAFGELKTSSYHVIFRRSSQNEIRGLSDSFDAVHQQVLDFFQNPAPVNGRIVLDTGSAVLNHAAGMTNWTKIRVPFSKAMSGQSFLQTLRHETGHVYISKISDGASDERFNYFRWFHEGVATAVELSPTDEVTARERLKCERWAAAVDARGRVPLAVLFDDNRLEGKYHESIVYPLGYVVATELIKSGGPGMIRRILDESRDLSLPPQVGAEQFWSSLLQKSGSSLELISAAVEKELDALKVRESEFLTRVPPVKATLRVEDGEIIVDVQPVEGGSESAELICWIRRPGVLGADTLPMTRSEDWRFRIPRNQFEGNRIEFFVGWRSPEAAYPIFEPLSEVVLPRGAGAPR